MMMSFKKDVLTTKKATIFTSLTYSMGHNSLTSSVKLTLWVLFVCSRRRRESFNLCKSRSGTASGIMSLKMPWMKTGYFGASLVGRRTSLLYLKSPLAIQLRCENPSAAYCDEVLLQWFISVRSIVPRFLLEYIKRLRHYYCCWLASLSRALNLCTNLNGHICSLSDSDRKGTKDRI